VKKTNLIIACLLVLIHCSHAVAEANIPAECRIRNRPPGRCGWCALETLARHQHIKALYGLAEKNARRACVEDLESILEENNITYRIQYRGSYETRILQDAIRKHRGAVVGFREQSPGKGGHIVTVIDFGQQEVRLIDPNDADGRVRTISRERFLRWWDGFTLVLNVDSE